MTEKRFEKYFVDAIKKLGGVAIKNAPPGFTGMPDRTVYMPGGKVYLVELKSPGGHIKGRQAVVRKQFEALGFRYFEVNSLASLHNTIATIDLENEI